MSLGTITSSNATFFLIIQNVYPTGVNLIGFGVDDAFVAEVADAAETQVGVDGYGVAGYRPREIPMAIRFIAASPSIVVFENWAASQDQANDVYQASAIITMPSIRRKYACQNGYLMRMSAMAEARRVLANREFRINWLPNGPGAPAISPAPI